GGLQNSGTLTCTKGPVETGAPKCDDPLATLPYPTPSANPITSCNVSGNCTVNPGTYTCRINIADGSNCVMQPGVYHLHSNSGITCGKGATITGSGVCIFNECGDCLDFGKAGLVTITPPS